MGGGSRQDYTFGLERIQLPDHIIRTAVQNSENTFESSKCAKLRRTPRKSMCVETRVSTRQAEEVAEKLK
jgi:hypothetical protein